MSKKQKSGPKLAVQSQLRTQSINARMRNAVSASKLAVSNWSPPSEVPLKVGVYEIKPEYTTPHRMYAYWNGAMWFDEAQSPDTAQGFNENISGRHNQQVTWRGIVK